MITSSMRILLILVVKEDKAMVPGVHGIPFWAMYSAVPLIY